MNNGTNHNDHEYYPMIEIMTDAASRVGRHDVEQFLPALADCTASLLLALAGERGLAAFISRIEQRISDFREGTFPPLFSLNTAPQPGMSVSTEVNHKGL